MLTNEKGVSYKSRLKEIGIAEWRFYESKRKYVEAQASERESGELLQLGLLRTHCLKHYHLLAISVIAADQMYHLAISEQMPPRTEVRLEERVKLGTYPPQHVNFLRLKKWIVGIFWCVSTKYMQNNLNCFKIIESVLKNEFKTSRAHSKVIEIAS